VILMAKRHEVSARKDIDARLAVMEEGIEANTEFLHHFFDEEDEWDDWFEDELCHLGDRPLPAY